MPIFELGCAIPVKSHVKIWFGLVEIGGMLSLRGGGAEDPLLEGMGVTCEMRCLFANLAELF